MRDTASAVSEAIALRFATAADVPQILRFIRGLGEYENLGAEVVATEESLAATLFGERRYAEVVLADCDGKAAGFALFFHNYSTFLARPGIYLEDLFVDPDFRQRGVGRALLSFLAQLTLERGCGRLEWSVLNWNQLAIDFYLQLGAVPMSEWNIYRLTGEPLRRLAG
jgi:GNAT superfamily N-acetyltransferase